MESRDKTRILVLLSRFPYPLQKGDKLRAYHQIVELSKNNSIYLFCLTDKHVKPEHLRQLEKYCAKISLYKLSLVGVLWRLFLGVFSQKPFQYHYFYSQKAQKHFDVFLENNIPEYIYCQLVRVGEYAKKYSIIPRSLDYMDALSKGMERRAQTAFFPLSILFKTEANRLKKYEIEIFNSFNNKCIISQQDKDYIKHPNYNEIEIIPNGVDYEYFKPIEKAKEFDLLFTGNMAYPPNIVSATYIVEKILPELRKEKPNVRLLISGTSPSFKVKSLASTHVKVSGFVEDIRDSYATSRIFIAPMEIGSGLQNKLLEAMAMGIPCITSSLANNALQATHEKEILIGNTIDEYVKHIVNLLENKDLYNQLAHNGRQFIENNYSWSAACSKLEKLIKK